MNNEINRLLNFALQQGLIHEEDKVYAANQLLGVLGLSEFEYAAIEEALPTATPILESLLDDAVSRGLIENTVTERDLLDTKIMNCLMPRPSEVIQTYNNYYENSPKQATDYFYQLSIASNYIRKDRTDKNICWKTATEYGNLDITINLSKPEKDPKEIAKAKLVKSTAYPKCLLCRENEGFYGNMNHPARNTHRLIPMSFSGENWFLQYSPYTYYNEHCIVLNANHTPMSIRKKTFENLLGFIEVLPHYFVGSNADLPIVGGSILSHDHYQGGRYQFAMETAEVLENYTLAGYEDVVISRLKWPLSVLRLKTRNKEKIIECANHILEVWRGYSDESADILAETNGEPHNTITPIARFNKNYYELDLVLRNNRTSEEHPLGIFHPHADVHNIKKENIGLIEVMGLAVLPARLKDEMNALKPYLLRRDSELKEEALQKHSEFVKQILENEADINEENVEAVIQNAVGQVFKRVLQDAGVFKEDKQGVEAFNRFIGSC